MIEPLDQLINVFARSQSAIISQGISVDDQNHALTGGYFSQVAQFGSMLIGLAIPGDGGLFAARFQPTGETRTALQTARNFVSGGVASELFVAAFTGNLAGDAYYAGHFKSSLRFEINTLSAATRRVFVAKVGGSSSNAPTAPVLGPPILSVGKITFTLPTQAGFTYMLQSSPSLGPTNWSVVQTIAGDGSVKTLEVPATGQVNFLRILIGM